MDEIVNVHAAKTSLSRLLARVEAGHRVVIARAGKPIADLVPHAGPGRTPGTLAGDIVIGPDAFSWPDDEIAAMFYGDDVDPA